MRGLLARVLAATLSVVGTCSWAGCDAVRLGTIADDSVKLPLVDAGGLDDVLREAVAECRLALIDAGSSSQGPEAGLNVCSVAPFFDGCPLRVCVAQLARRLAPQCPPPDAGLDTPDSRFCDAVVWPFLPDEP